MKPCLFSPHEATAIASGDPAPTRLIEQYVCPSVAAIDLLALKQVLQSGEPAVAYFWRSGRIETVRPDQSVALGNCAGHAAPARCRALVAQLEGRLSFYSMLLEEEATSLDSCDWRAIEFRQRQNWENYLSLHANEYRDLSGFAQLETVLVLISKYLKHEDPGLQHTENASMRDMVCSGTMDCNTISTRVLDMLWHSGIDMAGSVQLGQMPEHSTLWFPTDSGAGIYFNNGAHILSGDALEHFSERRIPAWQIVAGNMNDIAANLHGMERLALVLDAALQVDPLLPTVHSNAGNALMDNGKLDEAMSSYKTALELDPYYAGSHRNLGMLLLRLGNIEKAREELLTALLLSESGPGADIIIEIGVTFAAQKKWKKAVEFFRMALSFESENMTAHLNLGVALNSDGHPKDAIAVYRKALGINPNDVDIYYNLAVTLIKVNDVNGAINMLRKAAEIDPSDEDIRAILDGLQ